MPRKRNTGFCRDPKNPERGNWGHWIENKKGRNFWKSLGTTDEVAAHAKLKRDEDKKGFQHHVGANMTVRDGFEILRRDVLPKCSPNVERDAIRRYEETEHLWADFKLSDEKLTGAVLDFIDDQEKGIDRRILHTERGRAISAHYDKLKFPSIRLYPLLLRRIMNHVCTTRQPGGKATDMLYPRELAAKIPMPKKPKNYRRRKSAETALSKTEVANAFALVQQRRLDGPTPHIVSRAELALLILYFLAGQRSDRIAGLRWLNFNWDLATVDFSEVFGAFNSGSGTKQGKKDLKIAAEALDTLKLAYAQRTSDFVLGEFMTTRGFQSMIRKINAQVGVKGGSHIWRKTFATHAYEAGRQDRDIADCMGITLETLWKHYIQKGQRTDEEVVNSLPVKWAIATPSATKVVPLKG